MQPGPRRPPRRAGAAPLRRAESCGCGEFISFGALAVAGLIALLLALSRVPALGAVFPADFFYKGLVVHVIFSLLVWLLANLGMHMSIAAADLSATMGRVPGRMGGWLALAAFPCLLAPAFFPPRPRSSSNYIPLIDHPLYDVGLGASALGLFATALQLLANLRGKKLSGLPLQGAGAAAMACVYVLALLTFALPRSRCARRRFREFARTIQLGRGGHVLQFAYAALLLTNWTLLVRQIFGEKAVAERAFRLALALIVALALPSLVFYVVFGPYSETLREAYRYLKYGLGVPALLVGATLIAGVRRAPPETWDWRDPALVALALSVVLFALGGLMGAAITGSDTRTPAHYHAVITAVSLSCMGFWLKSGFSRLGGAPVSREMGAAVPAALWRRAIAGFAGHVRRRWLWRAAQDAGGGGVARHVAAAGMAVHGAGAVLAVCGGAGVVVLALRALVVFRA